MNLVELAVATHEVLDRAGLPHGFGGALALNLYADPRATLDVDVNVFVPWERSAEIVESFAELDYRPETPIADAVPVSGIRFVTPAARILLDAFPSLDPAYDRIRDRLVHVAFGPHGEVLPFLSATDLTVFKLSFNRDKDWVDLRRMVQAGPPLDLDVVEDTLIALRGPAMYPRIARLRALVASRGESDR